VSDIYDERAAQARDARPAALRAAAALARAYKLKGSSDPAYIANIIEQEVRRFEADPEAPVILRSWKGGDATTGLTADELLEATHGPFEGAARAAAISIARAYGPGPLGSINDFLLDAVYEIGEDLSKYQNDDDPTREFDEALAAINLHRKSLWMDPLDPVASEWTDDEVIQYAKELERLPNSVLELKRSLLLNPLERSG